MGQSQKDNPIFLHILIATSIPFLFISQSKIAFFLTFINLMAYAIITNKGKILSNEIIIFSVFFLSVLPSMYMVQHGASHYFYFYLTIASLLAARTFCNLSAKSILFILKFIIYIYILFAFIVYYLYRDLAEPFSGLVEGSSTNGIPSYLIVLQAVYSIIFYSVKKRLPITCTLLTLSIALLGIGRGSIYVASLIVATSIAFNLYITTIQRRPLTIICSFCLAFGLIVAAILHADLLIYFLSSKTKALQGIIDPYRNRIIIEYISSLTWWQIFVGGDYYETVISEMYDDNPHIAFIRSHAYFGIVYTVLILLSPFLFFLKSKSYIDSAIFFAFTSIILLRAWSEPILFPTALDFFYFLIFFFYYKHNHQTRKMEKQI